MIKDEPFSCQFWSAPDQQWALNIHESFSTIREAKEYGRENYKEFRVIEQGVVRYTRLWQDNVLVESVGADLLLAEQKGSTRQESLTRQEGRRADNTVAAARLLGNISSVLGGIDIELNRMQYAAKVMEHPKLANDLKRQRSLLGTEIRRIDNLSYKLETEE